MTPSDEDYRFEAGSYGFRLYAHDRDEDDVCRLCWKNALPGGRPFPLIPQAGARSFGRIVTGPFARHASSHFYVADDLANGQLIGYLTGTEGMDIVSADGKVPWATWRNQVARRIAQEEFGEISPWIWAPAHGLMQRVKLLYTISLGARAVQFLLHEKYFGEKEIPEIPPGPEFHFQVAEGHRGRGIGNRLVEQFLTGLGGSSYEHVCAQVTVCDGQKPLAYYRRMTLGGKRLWKIYDRRETGIYTPAEKQAWELGSRVENLSLLAARQRLLAFVRRDR